MITNIVLDASLTYFKTNLSKIIICSQLPTTRAQADTYKLAEVTSPTVSAPTSITNGRKVTVAQSSTTVATTGTSAYAVAVSTSEILGTKQLTGNNAQSLTQGNPLTIGTLDFEITTSA